MKTNNRVFFALLLLLPTAKPFAQKSLLIDRLEYSCATSFNVSVRTKNISNVVALQGSIIWDTSVVKYSGINFTSSGISLNSSNVNITAAVNGQLSFLWFDPNVQGRAVADSTALFTISFTRNGNGNGRGYVDFSNSPTQLEMDTTDLQGQPANNLDAVFTNGYVTTPSTYMFIGTGSWSQSSNWQNNQLPPAVLPACSEIIIDPTGTNTCSLDVPQTVSAGAKLSVANGKSFIVPGSLTIQ